jgi:hypothetical protein
MIQECLIGITKLAFDRYEQSLNARNLITALLAPEAKEARAALKAEFAVPIKPGPLLGEPTSEHLQDWEQFWKGEEQREAQVLEADFEKYLKALCEGWFWFESNRRSLVPRIFAASTDRILLPGIGPSWGGISGILSGELQSATLFPITPVSESSKLSKASKVVRPAGSIGSLFE